MALRSQVSPTRSAQLSAPKILDFPFAPSFSFPVFTKWTIDVLLCHTSHRVLFQERCPAFLPAPAAAALPALASGGIAQG